MTHLPAVATLADTLAWLNQRNGNWTLPRLLESGVLPFVWIDYSEAVKHLFGDRFEGFLAPLCFAGDVQRLAAGVEPGLMTMTRTPDGQFARIAPGISFSISELRFRRPDVEALVTPNYAYWCDRPLWTLTEAASLLSGREPAERFNKDRKSGGLAATLYADLKDAVSLKSIAFVDSRTGAIENCRVEPAVAVRWVESRGFPAPEQLAYLKDGGISSGDQVEERQTEERRAHGRYRLEEAALEIERNENIPPQRMLEKLKRAAHSGVLPVFAPGRNDRYVYESGTPVREFYEEAYWEDLNQWLQVSEPRIKFAFAGPSVVVPASTIDYDAELAALFDPVPVETLATMFRVSTSPEQNRTRWKRWVDKAHRNGLSTAKTGRGAFNPYTVSTWLVQRGQANWDRARCLRVLKQNLPARSASLAHLLGDDDSFGQ